MEMVKRTIGTFKFKGGKEREVGDFALSHSKKIPMGPNTIASTNITVWKIWDAFSGNSKIWKNHFPQSLLF